MTIRATAALWLLHPWRAWAQRQTRRLWAERDDWLVAYRAELIAAVEASRIEEQGHG